MLKVAQNIEELIGQTPLLKMGPSLNQLPVGQWLKPQIQNHSPFTIQSEVYTKVEFFNPGGSVKDRIAKFILDGLEKSGALKKGGTVVEASSGNTGAGLALCCARRGYKCIIVIPDKMSAEKINALRAYGADVMVTPAGTDPKDPYAYTNYSKKLAQELPNAVLANQYFNPDNPLSHYETTGPEIWEQMNGKIDYFAAGIGTGGTLSGTAKFLKEKNPAIKIIALDPYGSIYFDKIKNNKDVAAEKYLVEGVGEDEVPGTMDLSLPDDVVQINDEESFSMTHIMALKEGLLTGGSCGFALFGVAQYLRRHELSGGKPLRGVVLLPDSGSRYLSKVFNEPWLKNNQMKMGFSEGTQLGKVNYIANAKKIEGV